LSADEPLPPYAEAFMQGLRDAGVSIVAGLPESHLIDVYRTLENGAEGIRYVPVGSEAELPGIAAGAYLGGKRALMLMENSGLRQACEPIARFAFAHNMPLVMVMSYRGDFGEPNWWGHNHAQTMEPMLNALRIPYRIIRRIDKVGWAIGAAYAHADASQWPVAMVMAGECVAGGTEE
jgi:sulfopyruvate decarboxylase subunit alpha